MTDYDAVVVGAGPNGLAAAVEIARHERTVLVLEAAAEAGGGCRTAELTLPAFHHDVCAAIHPLGATSPFFASVPLADYGLEFVHPEIPAAHPLDDGSAGVLHRSLADTAAALGPDGAPYRRLVEPFVEDWDRTLAVMMGPRPFLPRPLLAAPRLGLYSVQSAERLARRFTTPRARALLAGMAAHAIARLDAPLTAGVGLALLITGHAVGWPAARGGSGQIIEALLAYLASLGGAIETGRRIHSLDDVPPAAAVLFDTSPQGLLTIAGDRLPSGYRRGLAAYRHGPGAFKMDWALDGPIPWANDACRAAGTVHVGGTFEEIAAAEAQVIAGEHPDRPFVLVAQQSVFDPTRAPAGQHTAWAYCHVPNGSAVDMSDAIERQIERFAPGFKDRILARNALGTAALERYNANYVGGDVIGGALSLRQFLARPVPALDQHRTPADGIYLCSASTPPGGGVHGMCGYHAARSALRNSLG